MQQFTVVPAVYIILRRADEILLIRRYNTGFKDGFYSVPAGRIDGGESMRTAAIREAQEEVGVSIQEEDLRFVHVLHRIAEEGDHERVDFFFMTETWQGEPLNNEPDKCDDIRWCDLSDLPDNTVTPLKIALSKIASNEMYSDADFG